MARITSSRHRDVLGWPGREYIRTERRITIKFKLLGKVIIIDTKIIGEVK